jgi:hypothetical protein
MYPAYFGEMGRTTASASALASSQPSNPGASLTPSDSADISAALPVLAVRRRSMLASQESVVVSPVDPVHRRGIQLNASRSALLTSTNTVNPRRKLPASPLPPVPPRVIADATMPVAGHANPTTTVGTVDVPAARKTSGIDAILKNLNKLTRSDKRRRRGQQKFVSTREHASMVSLGLLPSFAPEPVSAAVSSIEPLLDLKVPKYLRSLSVSTAALTWSEQAALVLRMAKLPEAQVASSIADLSPRSRLLVLCEKVCIWLAVFVHLNALVLSNEHGLLVVAMRAVLAQAAGCREGGHPHCHVRS